MAADSRFEIVRRGYDPQPVERELKALSAELVRLKEQNAELQAETLRLNQRLQDAEQELSLRTQPSYSALGAKASALLSTAEQVALGEPVSLAIRQFAADVHPVGLAGYARA